MGRALHLDGRGRARMVDVGAKRVTARRASAEGFVSMSATAFRALASGRLAKGDALAVARIAGISAAKKTAELVPLCHPIPIDAISVDVTLEPKWRRARITVRASTSAKTGVEMEALVAVAAACLSIYDMIKSLDRAARIEGVHVTEKSGGRSGTFRAPRSRR